MAACAACVCGAQPRNSPFNCIAVLPNKASTMARIQRLSHVLLCHLPHTPFFVLTFVNSALAMTCSLVAPHPHWKVAPTVVLLSKGVRVQFVTHDGRPSRQASAQAAMMVDLRRSARRWHARAQRPPSKPCGGRVTARGSWQGTGSATHGKNPHKQLLTSEHRLVFQLTTLTTCCMRVGDSEKTEGFPWRPLVRSAWPAGQI